MAISSRERGRGGLHQDLAMKPKQLERSDLFYDAGFLDRIEEFLEEMIC